MAADPVRAVPQEVNTRIGMALDGVVDHNQRFVLRRAMEGMYASGYADGWMNGGDESRRDAQAREDARKAEVSPRAVGQG